MSRARLLREAGDLANALVASVAMFAVFRAVTEEWSATVAVVYLLTTIALIVGASKLRRSRP